MGKGEYISHNFKSNNSLRILSQSFLAVSVTRRLLNQSVVKGLLVVRSKSIIW